MRSLMRLSVCSVFMMMGGCMFSPPSAPLPPVLPSAPAPVSAPMKVNVADLVGLQAINNHALLLQVIAKDAETHSMNPLIRSLAFQVMNSSLKNRNKIQNILNYLNVNFPDLDSAQKRSVTSFERLYGRDYDRAFLREVLFLGHSGDVKVLETLQNSGSTEEIRAFASEAKQVLTSQMGQSKSFLKSF